MTKPAIACVLLSIPTNSPELFTTPNALQCCFFGLTPVTQPAYQSKYASGGTPPTNVTASLSAAYGGDAYIASFNFATTGPTIGLYENEGGLSALSAR
jgi:hypothetical protein